MPLTEDQVGGHRFIWAALGFAVPAAVGLVVLLYGGPGPQTTTAQIAAVGMTYVIVFATYGLVVAVACAILELPRLLGFMIGVLAVMLPWVALLSAAED
jgi:hypothetical protein